MATTNIADNIGDCFPCDYQHDAIDEIIDAESLLAGARLLFGNSEFMGLDEKLIQADRLITMALKQLEFTRAKIGRGIVYEMQKSKADGPSLQ